MRREWVKDLWWMKDLGEIKLCLHHQSEDLQCRGSSPWKDQIKVLFLYYSILWGNKAVNGWAEWLHSFFIDQMNTLEQVISSVHLSVQQNSSSPLKQKLCWVCLYSSLGSSLTRAWQTTLQFGFSEAVKTEHVETACETKAFKSLQQWKITILADLFFYFPPA